MRKLGYSNLVHLLEFFEKGTKDETWLQFIGEKGYILITKDKTIRKNPKEKQALLNHKIIAFYLGGSRMGTREISKQLINAWDKMESQAKQQKKKGTAGAFIIRQGGGKIDDIPLT